jgi:hypothetical protein
MSVSEYSTLFGYTRIPLKDYSVEAWNGVFPFVTIYGYRLSGKTTLGKYFAHSLYYRLKVPRFTVFSYKKDWNDTVVSNFIVEPSTEMLDKIIEFQRNLIEKDMKENKKNDSEYIVPQHLTLCLVFDDIENTVDLIPLFNVRKELGIYVIDICQKRKYITPDPFIRTISPGLATCENGDMFRYERYNDQIGQCDFQFTDETLGEYPFIHVNGCAMSGKTSFGQYLLQTLIKDLNVPRFHVLVDVRCLRSKSAWKSVVNDVCDFSVAKLNDVLKSQREMVESDMKNSSSLIDYKVPKHLSLCIVIDELMYSSELQELLRVHKRLGIYVILITQWKNTSLRPDIKVSTKGLFRLTDRNNDDHIIRFDKVVKIY